MFKNKQSPYNFFEVNVNFKGFGIAEAFVNGKLTVFNISRSKVESVQGFTADIQFLKEANVEFHKQRKEKQLG